MAEYQLHRLDRTWVEVPLNELFTAFSIQGRVENYALDVWLFEGGHVKRGDSLTDVDDESLLDWFLDQRVAIDGGNNRERSEFEELRTAITLNHDEKLEVPGRLRKLLDRRDARS